MTVSCGFLLQRQFWAQFDIAEKCLGFRRHLNNVSNCAQIHQSLSLKVKGLSDALVYLYFSFQKHLRQSWCLKQTISKILDLGVLRYLLWMYHVFLGCFNKKNVLDCFPKLKDGTIYESDFRFTWKAVLELLLVHSSKDLCESYKSYVLRFNCQLWQIWAQFP